MILSREGERISLMEDRDGTRQE
jgi:hypothetical protein